MSRDPNAHRRLFSATLKRPSILASGAPCSRPRIAPRTILRASVWSARRLVDVQGLNRSCARKRIAAAANCARTSTSRSPSAAIIALTIGSARASRSNAFLGVSQAPLERPTI